MLYNCQAEYIDYEYCLNILHLPDFFLLVYVYFQRFTFKSVLSKLVSRLFLVSLKMNLIFYPNQKCLAFVHQVHLYITQLLMSLAEFRCMLILFVSSIYSFISPFLPLELIQLLLHAFFLHWLTGQLVFCYSFNSYPSN